MYSANHSDVSNLMICKSIPLRLKIYNDSREARRFANHHMAAVGGQTIIRESMHAGNYGQTLRQVSGTQFVLK